MAGKRTSAIRRKSGIKQRITARQKSARRKNIAIARKARSRKYTGGGQFKSSDVKNMIGRRRNTLSNRKNIGAPRLKSLIAYDTAKRRRRIKEYYSSGEGYSKKKALRKRADAYAMRKAGNWVGAFPFKRTRTVRRK